MFSSTGSKADQHGAKDTLANIRDTGFFCVNIVGKDMLDAMNATSATLPNHVDEFVHAGLEKRLVKQSTAPVAIFQPRLNAN